MVGNNPKDVRFVHLQYPVYDNTEERGSTMQQWIFSLLFLFMSVWPATATSSRLNQQNSDEVVILFSRFLTREEIITFAAEHDIAASTLYHGWQDQIGGFDIPAGMTLAEAVETTEDHSLAFVERAIEAENRTLATSLLPNEREAHTNLRDSFLARQEDVMTNGITFYAVRVRAGSSLPANLTTLPAVAGTMTLRPDSREVPTPAWHTN